MKTISIYPDKPITVWGYLIAVCIFMVVASACFVGIISMDWILSTAKSKQVPQLSIGYVEYFSNQGGEVVIVSGVTPEVKE